MTIPASNKPRVLACVDCIRSVYFDQQHRRAKEHNCWSLSVDLRALALMTLIIIVGVVQNPELLPKALAWGETLISKHF